VYSTAILPFTVALYVGALGKAALNAAFGVPTVGPMLLLIRWVASQSAETPRPTATSELPTRA